MAARDLYLDLQNAALVASSRGGAVNATNFPRPFHTDRLGLRLRLLRANPRSNDFSPLDPFVLVDPTGAAVTVKFYAATAPYSVLAAAGPEVWTPEAPEVAGAAVTALVGQLSLFTDAMQTAVAGLSPLQELSTILEITVILGDGDQYTIRHYPFPIRKTLNVASGDPLPLPSAQYLTRAEIEAQFVRFIGNQAGASITLRSRNGTYETILECADDGSNASNLIANEE